MPHLYEDDPIYKTLNAVEKRAYARRAHFNKRFNDKGEFMCCDCREYKPRNKDFFNKHNKNKYDGFNNTCKICTNAQSLHHRQRRQRLERASSQ